MPLGSKSRGLIWQYIALAADLDGTFAIARMQPLFPGGGEDRYGRGGPSEGRLSCRPPRVDGGVGRPGLCALPASRSCGTPASARPAVIGQAGDGAGRFAVVRGRSVDPRWLSDL